MMNYERENAKEWQNPGSRPDPESPGSDSSEIDYNDYSDTLIPVDTNETQDSQNGWQQVTYKKPASKSTPQPTPKPFGNASVAPKAPPISVRKTSVKHPAPPPARFAANLPAAVSAPPPARFAANLPPTHPAPPPARFAANLPAAVSAPPPARFAANLPATSSAPPPARFAANLPATVSAILPAAHMPTLPPTPKIQPTIPTRELVPSFQKSRVPTFALKNDNPAKAAFRAQQAHTSTFVLKKNCYAIEPDQKRIYDTLEELGVRLGSFIRPPQTASDRNLLLWGNDEQVKSTIRELQLWVARSDIPSHTTKGSNQFAKTGLLSQDKAKTLDKLMKREATKQRYQKIPDSSLKFDYIGYFLWPVDEIRPQDLLGQSYEAFDPIRIDYDSYIVFDNQLSLFKILSNKKTAVEAAMKRIEGTMKEFVARNGREIVVNMVERPDPQRMRSNVMLMERPAYGRSGEKAKIPMLTGETLAPAQLVQWKKKFKVAEESQFAQWRFLIGKVLKRLHLYRGRIQMRVLLGTFELTTFRRWPAGVDSIEFEKFLKDMSLSATKGRMIKDLQEKESHEVLLGYICKATKIFAPGDAMTTKLEDVSPVYTARFDFEIPGTGKVKLVIERSKPSSTDNLYEVTQSQWTRITEKVEAIHPMEVFMIRLQGGISWELQISTSQAVDPTRITPTMTAFADGVKFEAPKSKPKGKKAEISGTKVFNWKPFLAVSSFEQKTSLRYRLVDNNDWMFEFARYDRYDGLAPDRPKSTSWGASFWNSEWDRLLGQNAALKIGRAATWDPKLETFFPRSSRTSGDTAEALGLRQFLGNTKAIVEMLDGIQS